MPRYVALSKTAHRQAGVVSAGFSYALAQAAVPVVAEELPQLLPTMAVAFVRSSSEGAFQLVALQSLQVDVNVYVHTDGRWIGGYQPAWYRAHPFRLLPDETGTRKVVCIDEASPAIEHSASDEATRLFDDQGELTERAKGTVKFLEKLDKATSLTQTLVNQLDKAGLIVSWKLTAGNADGEGGLEVPGIYHIDENALKALAPDQLSELAKSGALSVAYSQLLSEHRLKGLERLYQLRSAAEKQNQQVDLEELFEGDEDDFTFNFDS